MFAGTAAAKILFRYNDVSRFDLLGKLGISVLHTCRANSADRRVLRYRAGNDRIRIDIIAKFVKPVR
jgi:hypothetical protein